MCNVRKKAIRWATAAIAAQKKRLKKQIKKDIAYHKLIGVTMQKKYY